MWAQVEMCTCDGEQREAGKQDFWLYFVLQNEWKSVKKNCVKKDTTSNVRPASRVTERERERVRGSECGCMCVRACVCVWGRGRQRIDRRQAIAFEGERVIQ